MEAGTIHFHPEDHAAGSGPWPVSKVERRDCVFFRPPWPLVSSGFRSTAGFFKWLCLPLVNIACCHHPMKRRSSYQKLLGSLLYIGFSKQHGYEWRAGRPGSDEFYFPLEIQTHMGLCGGGVFFKSRVSGLVMIPRVCAELTLQYLWVSTWTVVSGLHIRPDA